MQRADLPPVGQDKDGGAKLRAKPLDGKADAGRAYGADRVHQRPPFALAAAPGRAFGGKGLHPAAPMGLRYSAVTVARSSAIGGRVGQQRQRGQPLQRLHRCRRLGRDGGGKRLRAGQKVFGGVTSCTKPQARNSAAGKMPPGQEHVLRPVAAQLADAALGAAAAGHEAQLDLRQAEFRAVRGNDDVASEHHLEPPPRA